MTIKTITVSGVTEVDFDPEGKIPYFYSSNKFVWIKNKSDAAMYVSLDENCVADADETAQIGAGEAGRIELSPENKIYISGTGKAEIRTSDIPDCPFKNGGKGGETPLNYLGVTTTAIVDGDSTNPIMIDGVSVTAKKTDWVIYDSKDFIFNGTVWQEVGDFENYYTKSQTDTLLSAKANVSDVYAKTDTYSKTQADDNYINKTDVSFNYEATTAEINAAITNIWGA